MAGHSFVMIGWKWTEGSVLGSQVFGHALVESIGDMLKKKGIINKLILLQNRVNFILYFKLVTLALGTTVVEVNVICYKNQCLYYAYKIYLLGGF